MGIQSHFIHTCTLQRATNTVDAYGANQALWADWQAYVRCRLVTKAQRVADSATGEYPVVTTYVLLLSAHTGVRVGDRVVNIVDRQGNTDAGPYRIEAVLARQSRAVHHISVQLERVR